MYPGGKTSLDPVAFAAGVFSGCIPCSHDSVPHTILSGFMYSRVAANSAFLSVMLWQFMLRMRRFSFVFSSGTSLNAAEVLSSMLSRLRCSFSCLLPVDGLCLESWFLDCCGGGVLRLLVSRGEIWSVDFYEFCEISSESGS